MVDVILDFFESDAAKNHWVLLVALLVISCAIGCFVTAFIIHKVYIPWKKKQITESEEKIAALENEISTLKEEKEQLIKNYNFLNENYQRLHERNQKCAIEVDYENYKSEPLSDAALSEFISE